MTPRPKDSAALMAFERLTTVASAGPNVDTGRFTPGAESTDTVCHLTTLTDPMKGTLLEETMNGEPFEFSLTVRFMVEIFLSRHGSELLRIRQEKEALYAGLKFEDPPRIAVILAELPGHNGQDESTDFFEGQVLELVVRPVPPSTPAEVMAELLPYVPHIPTYLPRIIGMERGEFLSRIRDLADDASSPAGAITRSVAKGAGALLTVAADGVGAVAKFLNDHSRMPKELWHPTFRPKNFTDLLQRIERDMDSILNGAVDEIETADLGLSAAATVTAGIPGLGDLVAKIEALWLKLRNFMVEAVRVIHEVLNKDSIDTILGYGSGLWDGIMEAVIGLLELAALALKLLGAFLSASQNLSRVADMIRETADEILQALARIDWLRFLLRFYEEIVPLILELLKKKGSAFIDTATRSSAVAGYYFGYLVYTIAEFFFPPLEIAKISKALRTLRATYSARFFAKVAV